MFDLPGLIWVNSFESSCTGSHLPYSSHCLLTTIRHETDCMDHRRWFLMGAQTLGRASHNESCLPLKFMDGDLLQYRSSNGRFKTAASFFKMLFYPVGYTYLAIHHPSKTLFMTSSTTASPNVNSSSKAAVYAFTDRNNSPVTEICFQFFNLRNTKIP